MSPDTEQLYGIKEIGFREGLTNALWFHLRQTYNLQLQNTSLVLYLKDNLRVFREANMHFGGLWEEVRIPGKKKKHTRMGRTCELQTGSPDPGFKPPFSEM